MSAFSPMAIKRLTVGTLLNTVARLRRIAKAWRWAFLTAFVILLCLAPSLGLSQEPSPSPANTPEQIFTLYTGDRSASASRGTSVRVSGASPIEPLAPGSPIVLELSGKDKSKQIEGKLLATSDAANKAPVFEFVIPPDLELGEYSPHLLITEKDQTIKTTIAIDVAGSTNKMLTINSAAGILQPKVISISPAKVIFPDESHSPTGQKHAHYSFTVLGSGFSPTPSDNHLAIYSVNSDEGEAPFKLIAEPDICWMEPNRKDQSTQSCPNNALIGIRKNSRRIDFKNVTFDKLGNDLKGEVGIAIRVGDQESTVSKVVVSGVPQSVPVKLALAGLGTVLLILWGIANRHDSKPLQSVASLIIDPETRTYSLSRFQFALWTVVAILSYFFLFFSETLAQGKLEFIDIPSGLPAIILASAATSFFAIGIDNTKGGKGSGPEPEPAWSDLISAGGNIQPDRLQFLAWTIIGVVVYTFTVLSQNPGFISGLPTIPEGFLQLSGVSALGYLGGKLVRAPGPVISSIENSDYNKEGKFLTLTLNGKNLSKDASFILEDGAQGVIFNSRTIGIAKDPQDDSKAVLRIIEAQPGDSAMATKLKIQIPSDKEKWDPDKSQYKITLTNPDSQVAAWKFDGPMKNKPIIESVDSVGYNNGLLTLTLNGQNLSKDAFLLLANIEHETIVNSQIKDKAKDPQALIKLDKGVPQDSTLATKLEIQITSDREKWDPDKSQYKITLTNPDSQVAELMFDGPMKPTIESLDSTNDGNNLVLILSVRGLAQDASVLLTDKEENPIYDSKGSKDSQNKATISQDSPNKLVVKIPLGGTRLTPDNEPYTIALTSPDSRTAKKQFAAPKTPTT